MSARAGAHLQARKKLLRSMLERHHQHLRTGQQGRQQHIIGCDIAQQRGSGDRRFKHRLGGRHRAKLTTHCHQSGTRRLQATAIFRHHQTAPAEFRHLLPTAAIKGRCRATQRAQSRARQSTRAEIGGTVGHQSDQVVVGFDGGTGWGGLIHVGTLLEIKYAGDSARRRQNTNCHTMPAAAQAANTGKMPLR